MRIGRGVGVSALAAIICAVVLVGGCGRETTEKEDEGAAIAPYPPALSAQSSPSQVAAVLIRALDEDDDDALAGLVAVKHEMEAIAAIYRQHGREYEGTPAQAAAATVAGWKASWTWYEPGATHVTAERINSTTAVVEAEGLNPMTGRPRGVGINMVREDGVWKVAAGLESYQH